MATEIRYTAPWKIALAFILWGIVTGGFLYFAATHLYDDYRFSHHAVPVTGTVVQKYYTVSHGRHGSTTYTYHLSYNYVVGDMHGFCTQTIQYATYNYLQADGPVPVMYLADDPSKVRVNLQVEERAIRIETGILCAVALLFLVAGAIGFTMTFRSNSIYQRLQREGMISAGVVTNIGIAYVGKTRTRKSYLEFEYRDAQGATLQGRSLYLTGEQELRWRAGDRIDVRYDRNNPRSFTIELNPSRIGGPDADGSPSNRA